MAKKTQEEQTTQLQEQIALLQSLCEKITQEVELPAQAPRFEFGLLIEVSEEYQYRLLQYYCSNHNRHAL